MLVSLNCAYASEIIELKILVNQFKAFCGTCLALTNIQLHYNCSSKGLSKNNITKNRDENKTTLR